MSWHLASEYSCSWHATLEYCHDDPVGVGHPGAVVVDGHFRGVVLVGHFHGVVELVGHFRGVVELVLGLGPDDFL